MDERGARRPAGRGEPENAERLRLDAGKIVQRYSETDLPGHSTWIDGPWKLHRIADKTGGNVKFELYDLGLDPKEAQDRLAQEPDRAEAMKWQLQAWRQSVIHSLNGDDY